MKFINQLSKRERILFYLTTAIISLSLMFRYVLIPLFDLNQKLTQELKAKKIELRRAKRLAQGESIQGEYEAFIKAIRMYETEEMEMARLLSEIERIAKDAGVNILNLRPHTIEDRKFYKKFSLELKSEGTNQAILKFTFLLESSPLLLRIDKINLGPGASRGGLLNANLTLSRLAIP